MIHFMDPTESPKNEEGQKSPRKLTSRLERRRARKMAELLNEALELVLETGVPGFTVGALADRMDWSAGTLYRYFSGKDSLLAAVHIKVIDELHADLKADIDSLGLADEPLAGVLAAAQSFRRFALEQPGRFHLIATILADPRPLIAIDQAGPTSASMRALLAILETQLELCIRVGSLEVGDSSRRSVTLWSALHGLLLFATLGRLEPRMRQATVLAESAVDDLLRSWGASPSALASAHMLLLELDR